MDPDPKVFGPHMWFTLHTISFFYPEIPHTNDMLAYKEFYEKFARFIPCNACKQHYNQYIHDYPIDGYINSRETLSRWVVNLHNNVNRRLGKQEVPYDEVVRIYRKTYSHDQGIWQAKNLNYLYIVLAICAFIYWKIHTPL